MEFSLVYLHLEPLVHSHRDYENNNSSFGEVRLIGIDLVDGQQRQQTLGGTTVVRMSDLPLGPFAPPELAKLSNTKVAAAALWKGYHIVLKGIPCEIVHVWRTDRWCPEVDRRNKIRVVGREVFTGRELESELDMTAILTVGRFGMDVGACKLH